MMNASAREFYVSKRLKFSLENKHLLEVTTELQRVHESGILLYGRNIFEELPVPSREEIIYFNELSRKWSKVEVSKSPVLISMLLPVK